MATVDEAFTFASQRIVRAPEPISYRPKKLRSAAKLESTAQPSNRYEVDHSSGSDDIKDASSSDSDDYTSEEEDIEASNPPRIAASENWNPSRILDQWNKAFGTDSESQRLGRPLRHPSTAPESERPHRRLQYIPGGAGGGGRYLDPDTSLETPIGSRGAGGYFDIKGKSERSPTLVRSGAATNGNYNSSSFDTGHDTILEPSAPFTGPLHLRRSTPRDIPAAKPQTSRSIFTPIDDSQSLLDLWMGRSDEHSTNDESHFSAAEDILEPAPEIPWPLLLRKGPVDSLGAHYTISRDVA